MQTGSSKMGRLLQRNPSSNCNNFFWNLRINVVSFSVKYLYATHVVQPATTHVIIKGSPTNPARLAKPATRFQNHEPSIDKYTVML
jgi:hypothetical protein